MARDRQDWDIGVTGGAHVPVLAISCPGSRAARAIAAGGPSAWVIARTTTIRSAPARGAGCFHPRTPLPRAEAGFARSRPHTNPRPAREPALDGAQVG